MNFISPVYVNADQRLTLGLTDPVKKWLKTLRFDDSLPLRRLTIPPQQQGAIAGK